MPPFVSQPGANTTSMDAQKTSRATVRLKMPLFS
jgi:hypothetical protein